MGMDVWRWLEEADDIYSVKAVYKEIMGEEVIIYQHFINLLFFAQEDVLYNKQVSTCSLSTWNCQGCGWLF